MLRDYLLIATRLRLFCLLIIKHGISLQPSNIFRFLFLLQSSVSSSFLAFREHITQGSAIRKTPVPRDPVFIVGHWRTGSTFLHQLFSCDPGLKVPSLLECTYPESFMTSRKFIAPVMNHFLPKKRPMDNVDLGVDDPQEDEYALFRMTGFSPLEKLIFPRTDRYFLFDTDDFLPDGPKRVRWEQAFKYFARKLTLHSGKRIIFKNPFHSLRIPTLLKLFPDARFIHIYRDPRAVIPSTRHMWTVVGHENALRKEWQPPTTEDIISYFDFFMDRTYESLDALPEEKYTEIRFEDLEEDPSGTMYSLYKKLGIDFTSSYAGQLEKFLRKTAAYKKNTYKKSSTLDEQICNSLHRQMERGGYIKK